MSKYDKYINALKECAKEHENDATFTGYIIVSDLCRDTAKLLEEIKQESKTNKSISINIPEDATNCEVLKTLFPNLEWTGACKDVDFYLLDSDTPYSAKLNTFRSWWNMQYKHKKKKRK